MELQDAKDLALKIERTTKQADHAYKPTTEQAKTLIIILKKFALKKEKVQKLLFHDHPVNTTLKILRGTIDKDVARLLREFLEDNKTPKLNDQVETQLRSMLMRMASF